MNKTNRGRLPHVLLLYRSMIPSIRLCGHGQMQQLAVNGWIDYCFKTVWKVRRAELEWADIVLLGRLDGWYEQQLVKALKACGKYLIYILDDDLLHIPDGLSVSSYYRRKDVQYWIQSMLKMSDALLSTSPLLLEEYGKGKEKLLTEGFAVQPVFCSDRREGEPIRIGFAGSLDRCRDVETILHHALCRVKGRYADQVSIEFFGIAPAFAAEVDAKIIPYVDNYENYRERLNEMRWDIGLAPMADTPFHSRKYYNKFIEYSAAGVVGVYSAVQPYLRLNLNEEMGIFCENTPEAWTQAICCLVEDAPLRETMRRKANEYVRENMTVEHAASVLRDRMESILDYRPEACHMRTCLSLMKLVAMCRRAMDALVKYKWGIFKKLLKKQSDG